MLKQNRATSLSTDGVPAYCWLRTLLKRFGQQYVKKKEEEEYSFWDYNSFQKMFWYIDLVKGKKKIKRCIQREPYLKVPDFL